MPRLARRAWTSGWNGVARVAVRAARAGRVVRCTTRSKSSGAAAIASSVATASGVGSGSGVTDAASRAGVSGGPGRGGASVGLEHAVVGEVLEQARRARAQREVAPRAAD